jgi:hypothetical protein
MPSGEDLPIDDNAAAHTGSQDDPEHGFLALCRTKCCLCKGAAVGIVGKHYAATENTFQIIGQGATI